LVKTSPVAANCPAHHVTAAIRAYYRRYWGSTASVKVYTEGTKRTYQVTVDKLITKASVKSVRVMASGTKAKLTVAGPDKVQLSSPPLSGKYKIKCTSKTGAISYSDAISYHESALGA